MDPEAAGGEQEFSTLVPGPLHYPAAPALFWGTGLCVETWNRMCAIHQNNSTTETTKKPNRRSADTWGWAKVLRLGQGWGGEVTQWPLALTR